MDVRSHPLGLESPAIRITMYNPQVAEITPRSREACAEIAHSHRDARPDERRDLGARSRRGVRYLYLQPIETIAEIGAFMKSFMEKHG